VVPILVVFVQLYRYFSHGQFSTITHPMNVILWLNQYVQGFVEFDINGSIIKYLQTAK